MADDNGDVKQAGEFEDSNMANYGSKEHVDARKAAAKSEPEYKGAGTKAGLEIWRVENKRTKNDTPDFGIKRWPKNEYGNFYSGDSYIVMNTYVEKASKKLQWDVHFWLGKNSSQDEVGVAAYKAIELDDLLDDGPIQHREVQGQESDLFKSYFRKGIHYMDGGIESGFRHVKPEEYEPRLFHVKRTGAKLASVSQVPVSVSSMNEGDCFILDAGVGIYTFVGKTADPFEKAKAAALAHNLVAARMGKAKDKKTNLDDDFWKIVKGKRSDVKSGGAGAKPKYSHPVMDSHNLKLMKVSDANGSMQFSNVKSGVVYTKDLDTNDVFIIDGKLEIFVWTGKNASWAEKSQAMKYATKYLKDSNLNQNIPITRINEGQVHHVFNSILDGKNRPKAGGGGSRMGGGRSGGGGWGCTIS